MTFDPVLPWAILAVVAGALVVARGIGLWQGLRAARHRRVRVLLRGSGVTLAVLLILVAAARPVLVNDAPPGDTATEAGDNLNVFLVVDRSADSGVSDYGTEQRILGIRADITALTEHYPGARYALITFSSRAVMDWPLSEDVWSMRPTVAALTAYGGGQADVDAAAADRVLHDQLVQASQQYPGSRNVVLYFGSGAPGSLATQSDFELRSGLVSGGAVLGYGRADVIDEDRLRRTADQIGVPYGLREPGEPFRPDLPLADVSAEAADTTELYWVAALLAALLLLAEIYLSAREYRRGRIVRRDVAP